MTSWLAVPGVEAIYAGEKRTEIGLNHARSGELVLLSRPNAWFAYPFWLDDQHAPDYARAVAIHHKPGYDPCELLVDPKIWFPTLRVIRKVLAKEIRLPDDYGRDSAGCLTHSRKSWACREQSI